MTKDKPLLEREYYEGAGILLNDISEEERIYFHSEIREAVRELKERAGCVDCGDYIKNCNCDNGLEDYHVTVAEIVEVFGEVDS